MYYLTGTFYVISIMLALIIVLFGKYKNEKRTNYLHENRDPEYNPLVTVIIPTWNEEEVIENTIRTVENSSYKNIEIIVIDDNSEDDTYKIAKNLEREFSNLKVIQKKGKRGKPQSINEAMEIANGEIILMIDADARVPENYISSHIFCFSNKKVNMIFTNFEAYNFKFKAVHIIQEIYFNFVKAIFYSNIFVKMIFMGNGVFFRRNLLVKLLPIDPETLVDDFSMATKLSKMGVKEYYSTYPYIGIQYVSNFKDLWKQHKRWYVGGFREMFKRIKEGHYFYFFIYLIIGFIIFSPIYTLVIDIFLDMDLFLYLLGLIIGVYILLAVSSFDSRKMGVVSLFYSLIFTPLLMLFQLGVLIESYILGPLNKVTEWYKVKREKM